MFTSIFNYTGGMGSVGEPNVRCTNLLDSLDDQHFIATLLKLIRHSHDFNATPRTRKILRNRLKAGRDTGPEFGYFVVINQVATVFFGVID